MRRKFFQSCQTYFNVYRSNHNITKCNEAFNGLKAKILFSGPITVHDYMKEVLTNPRYGYYMTKDVFGKSGDFITSPEVSQLFGEMVAIWTVNEWEKIGAPKPMQLVELGPGRGTMMRDILRTLNKLKGISQNDISVHLIEVSPEMRSLQAKNICESVKEGAGGPVSGVTSSGLKVSWHSRLQELPDKFSCMFAHEFFDALPIHILKKTDTGWREILVGLGETEDKLQFLLSKNPTPACIYSKYSNGRDYFEFSPQAGVVMDEMARRLEEFGGIALVIDYGHDGTKGDTFRAFREHKMVDPLLEPGTSDLTADVDFAFLKVAAGDRLISFGPVTQRHFLNQLHIDVRLKMLLRNCSSEKTKEEILSGYHMITDSDKMGHSFKFMSFFPAVLKEHLAEFPVAGFLPTE